MGLIPVPLQCSSPRAILGVELWMPRLVAVSRELPRSVTTVRSAECRGITCHTSPRHVRGWVSVGWARTKIRFPYFTENMRGTGGSNVWLVWDYTGSCRSPSRPLTVGRAGMWVPDMRYLGSQSPGTSTGGAERQSHNICQLHVKIFVIERDHWVNSSHYCKGILSWVRERMNTESSPAEQPPPLWLHCPTPSCHLCYGFVTPTGTLFPVSVYCVHAGESWEVSRKPNWTPTAHVHSTDPT